VRTLEMELASELLEISNFMQGKEKGKGK